MKPGDEATWLHTPRGGYGYTVPVDVVVVKVKGQRVRVAAPLVAGGEKRVWVDRANLKEKP